MQQKVSSKFKNAQEKMNVIESEYAKISWESDASNAFRERFNRLKSNIVKAFEDLDSSFTKLMGKTIADIQNKESANTVQ